MFNRLNVAVKQVALGRAWTADDLKAAGTWAGGNPVVLQTDPDVSSA